MRRADRLFQIIQNLHHDRAVTAHHLADGLQVSERTIYRDIQDLSLSGVPITGEAGHGYRLMKGFQLSPLMFTEEELAALLLGARMVQAWTDKGLARAAQQAMAKIERVIPDHLKPELARQDILVPDFPFAVPVSKELEVLRHAIKQQRKVRFDYRREDGQHSARTVHPLGLFYWGKVWTLVAWCELRGDFRHFRLDRMSEITNLSDRYELLAGRTLQDYLAQCDPRLGHVAHAGRVVDASASRIYRTGRGAPGAGSEALEFEPDGVDSSLGATFVLRAGWRTAHAEPADDRAAAGDRQAAGGDDESVDLGH